MGQAVTEQQASQKWCERARVASLIQRVTEGADIASTTVASVNRHPERRDPFEGAHCVASDCMHWQWMPGQRGKGYCGLSEKPPN